MKHPDATDVLERIMERDPRYREDAYFFVREALHHTVSQLERPRHVSGQELLDGIRDYAIKEYGVVAKRVLNEWGIHECIDFGHIVFNLVSEGLLGKTDEDRLEDFLGGYDFHDAFVHPFRPVHAAC